MVIYLIAFQMENIVTNPSLLQEMFSFGMNIDELAKYSNIFIGMFCFIQLINISFKFVDYIIGEKKQTHAITVMAETRSDDNEEIEQESEEQNEENQEDEKSETSETDDTHEEIQMIRSYSAQIQNKISKIIALHHDLFTDRRAQTRIKYHINKEITDYFKAIEFLIDIEKNKERADYLKVVEFLIEKEKNKEVVPDNEKSSETNKKEVATA